MGYVFNEKQNWVQFQAIFALIRKSTKSNTWTETNESKQKHFSHENDNQNDNYYGMRWSA